MKRILCLLAWVSVAAVAQTPEQMELYFSKVLQGLTVEVPGRKCSVSDLAERRKAVWQAWKNAHAALKEPGLPSLDSLGAAPVGRWDLPAALEPQATLPFYFGSKGACAPREGYPVFLYLHGSGPKDREWANGLLLARRFEDAPSLYFIPQIPNEGQWYRWWQRSKQFAWERLLRQLLLRDDVNPNRLYVFGISEGGYGSQRLASYYADYWAAAGPMAGGEPLKNAPAENLSNTPLSLLTGADDKGFYRNLLTGYTRASLDSLENLDKGQYKHRVELIPGRGHHIDYSTTTPWLSRFVRNPAPRHFKWEDYEMDGRHRMGFYNLLVNDRPKYDLRTRYDVDIEDNHVSITVSNVHYITTERDSVYGIDLKFRRAYVPATSGAFTIFLDERLVDLSRPVSVMVNGRIVFAEKLKLSTRNLLRSAAAFYDPERLFPAAVEVKL